jgi:hypothetical protein
MIAFMGQVLSVMTGPLMLGFIILGLICACIPRPLPVRMLAAAGAFIFLLFYEYMLSSGPVMGRVRRPPRFDFWDALPAWAVAGALMALLWFLIIRGLVWALNSLPQPPDPPKPPG